MWASRLYNTSMIDKNKKREAFKRWYLKNKTKHRFYNKIRYIAQKKYPIAQNCSINGCTIVGERHHPNYDKPDEIIWLCKEHHEKEHHKNNRYCKICNVRAIAFGLCNKHYKQERKKSDPAYHEKTKLQTRLYMQNKRKK